MTKNQLDNSEMVKEDDECARAFVDYAMSKRIDRVGTMLAIECAAKAFVACSRDINTFLEAIRSEETDTGAALACFEELRESFIRRAGAMRQLRDFIFNEEYEG